MRSPFLAIVALVGFVCAAVLGFSPTTRTGVQCPTARVQTVVERDCCGRIVKRAPQPGDRAFVQCACAEKKSASQKAIAGTKVDFWISAGEPLVFDAPPLAEWRLVAYVALRADWSEPPGLRPPTLS